MIKNACDHYTLTVLGDSMHPKFQPGAVLFVDPDMEWDSGSLVIAENPRGQKLFRRIDRAAGSWYLAPLNSRYPVEPLGEFQVIGVVYQSAIKPTKGSMDRESPLTDGETGRPWCLGWG